ncbi:MAG: GNAT family N-acetyltransferase [Chloroflexota bacterium]
MYQPNINIESETQIDVRVISVSLARELRASILRPDLSPAMNVYLGDDALDTLHLGAFKQERLVGIASLLHQAPKEFAGSHIDSLWLLRGMATLPQVRGQGYGTALIQTACAYVACEHGLYLWCEARENALGFYEKLGFDVLGNRFNLPPTGLHYRMWRPITPADAAFPPF